MAFADKFVFNANISELTNSKMLFFDQRIPFDHTQFRKMFVRKWFLLFIRLISVQNLSAQSQKNVFLTKTIHFKTQRFEKWA